jgi:competence protein ComEC
VRDTQRYRASIRRALGFWAAAEAGRFILFLPVCMAAGIVAFFAWHGQPPASPAVLVAAICLAGAWVARAHPLAFVLICCVFAALGFAAAQQETARAPPFPDLPRRAAVVTGRIATLDRLPEGRRVTLTAPSLDGQPPLARTLRIRLRNTDDTVLAAGDMIQVRALLRPPAPPAYPGAWDTERDAYFAGLAGYGFAIGAATRLHEAPVTRWQAVRSTIQDRILATLPGAPGAIAATLLTGLGSAIPPGDRSAFQDSGLAHLLAVAGLHIGIVMGLTFAAFRRGLAWSEHAALHWPCKPIAAVASLAAGLFYLALTGAHVPILRSFAMACLVTLALITGRRALSLRGLALAATVLMLASPDLVMGVSFQMSFAAVLALIAGWEALSPHLAPLRGPGWARFLARHAIAGVATSVLAGTASLPVAAYHFGNATLYYVPANLLAVPLTALWVMPWGLAALALMPLGLHPLALAPMGWGIAGLLRIAHTVSAWPDASVPLGQMPASTLCLFTLGLAWLCLWRSRWRLAGILAMSAGLAVAIGGHPPDILVDDGARLVAVRVGGEVFVSAAPGVSRYDRQAPARLWGIASQSLFPTAGPAAGGAIACQAASCRITLHRAVAELLRDVHAPCARAAIVLAHGNVACPDLPIVDRGAAAAQGATTIWLAGGTAVIRTVEGDSGVRPWTLARPALPQRLPSALTE